MCDGGAENTKHTTTHTPGLWKAGESSPEVEEGERRAGGGGREERYPQCVQSGRDGWIDRNTVVHAADRYTVVGTDT